MKHRSTSPMTPSAEGPVPSGLHHLEMSHRAQQTMFAYCDAVDRTDLQAVGQVIGKDFSVEIGDVHVVGHANALEFFAGAFDADPSKKRHFVTNVMIQATRVATVEIQALFFWTGRTSQDSIFGFGQYQATVDVRQQAGKLTRLKIDIDHAGDVRQGWPSPETTHVS